MGHVLASSNIWAGSFSATDNAIIGSGCPLKPSFGFEWARLETHPRPEAKRSPYVVSPRSKTVGSRARKPLKGGAQHRVLSTIDWVPGHFRLLERAGLPPAFKARVFLRLSVSLRLRAESLFPTSAPTLQNIFAAIWRDTPHKLAILNT